MLNCMSKPAMNLIFRIHDLNKSIYNNNKKDIRNTLTDIRDILKKSRRNLNEAKKEYINTILNIDQI